MLQGYSGLPEIDEVSAQAATRLGPSSTGYLTEGRSRCST